MDAAHFDRIAKTWATPASRRRTLAAVLGGAGLLVLRRAPVGAAPFSPGNPAHCCHQARHFKDVAFSGRTCCPLDQVCFACAAIGKQKGEATFVAQRAGCCTRGVDCPEDVHGHHSQQCQSFVNAAR
jgi:hypothetical protein